MCYLTDFVNTTSAARRDKLERKENNKSIPVSPILYFILKNNQSLVNVSSIIINNLLMYHTLQ